MSTQYKLYSDDNFGELQIDESSNKLSFNMAPADEWYNWYSESITPKEMAKIFLEGLTVCSYWMDTEELKELINNHVKNNIF